MDLFSETNSNPVMEQILGKSWYEQLNPYINWDKIEQVLRQIKKDRGVFTVYPSDNEIFRAFKATPYEDVKIVIVGQDPYHNGNADGLAFSCKMNLSPSLKQIFLAMAEDLHKERNGRYIHVDQTIKLDYLAKQGVFLYNPTLTVLKGSPGTHSKIGWDELTKHVFRALFKKHNLIWMVWGKEADKNLDIVMRNSNDINFDDAIILREEHPAAAVHGNRQWKCNHFSFANAKIKALGKEPIKWLQDA